VDGKCNPCRGQEKLAQYLEVYVKYRVSICGLDLNALRTGGGWGGIVLVVMNLRCHKWRKFLVRLSDSGLPK
jgi:hypothetical protein